jgi:hypothetical protein
VTVELADVAVTQLPAALVAMVALAGLAVTAAGCWSLLDHLGMAGLGATAAVPGTTLVVRDLGAAKITASHPAREARAELAPSPN